MLNQTKSLVLIVITVIVITEFDCILLERYSIRPNQSLVFHLFEGGKLVKGSVSLSGNCQLRNIKYFNQIERF